MLNNLEALRYAGRFFYDRKKERKGKKKEKKEKRNKIIMAL